MTILAAALHKPPGARRAYVLGACRGDEALFRAVSDALEQQDRRTGLLPDRVADDSPTTETTVCQPVQAGRPAAGRRMQLQRGTRLGSYEIVAPLGAGGIGQVYRARDLRLGRTVAIKVLSGEMASRADMRRRLEREARAISGLSDSHICTLYDVGEDRGITFLVMEYLEGQTLAARLAKGPLKMDEVLAYAVQVADALEHAHSRGVIHRDLKPGNIMLTRCGAKVLDFGLAKLQPGASAFRHPDATEAASLNSGGMLLGTAGYIAPEQIQERNADARSDIFSLGVVLYEMATGRRAFARDSWMATLAATLTEEPKAAPRQIPPGLERIIARCLRKEPSLRYQHAGDLKLALLELKEHSESGAALPDESLTGRSPRIPWRWLVALAAFLLALGILVRYFRASSPAVPTTRVIPLTSYAGYQRDPALSPDGKRVAFSWDGEDGDNFDIYVRSTDTAGTPFRLTTNPARDGSPAWSPDASRIAFLRHLGATMDVLTVPSLGGQEQKLGTLAAVPYMEDLTGLEHDKMRSERSNPMTVSWSPDGKYLAVVDRGPRNAGSIVLLSAETGEKHRLTSPSEYPGDFGPRFSRDGKSIAFIRSRSPSLSDIYVVPVTTSSSAAEPLRVTFFDAWIAALDWTPDGRRLVFSAKSSGGLSLASDRRASVEFALWTIPLAGGSPAPLTGAGQSGGALSVSSRSNRLAYQRSIEDSNIWRMPGPKSHPNIDPLRNWISSTEMDAEPQFSPDGTKIVFSSSRTGTTELWTCDASGRRPAQLTFLGGPPAGSPRWSPDSRWISFDSAKAGKADIYIVSLYGGTLSLLASDAHNNVRPSWSKDGRWIYFASDRTGIWQVWKAPVPGGDAVQVTIGGGYEAFESSDRKWVFYSKYRERGIWRVPVDGGGETRVVDGSGTSAFALTEEGIAFFDQKDALHRTVRFYSLLTRNSTLLYEFPRGTHLDTDSTALSVSPDGRWILYTQLDQAGSNLVLMDNFR